MTSLKERQKLVEMLITELVEFDSVQAEKYFSIWKDDYYPMGTPQKIFYHKNRGILFLNYANYQASLSEITKGIALSEKANDNLSLADLYNNRANVYSEMEDDAGALADYDKAIALYKKIGLPGDEALVLSNKANLYGTKGRFKEAIPYALEALNIREKLKDDAGAANTSFNLGIMFKNVGRYEEALNYLQTAERFYLKKNNEKSLATVYLVKGSVYRSKEMYEESKSYFQKAIPVLEKYKFKGGLVNAFENLGTIAALADHDENKALSYYEKAEDIVKGLNNVQGQISTGINVAQSFLNLGRIEEFNAKVDRIEKLAREHKYQQELQEILKLRMLYAFEKSSESGGKDYLDEFEKIRDSVSNRDIQSQISDLKVKYETERKEAQIKLLHKQNELQKQVLASKQLALLANELELDKKNLQLGNQKLLIANQELDIKNKNVTLANNTLELKNNQQKIDLLSLSDNNKSLKIQQKNKQIVYGLIAFVLLAALGFLYFNKLKMEQRAKLQEARIDEQDKAARAIISAEENERSRMSQNLHDGLGQLLSATKMNLQAAIENLPEGEKSRKIYSNSLELIDESIAEMRSVSHEMVTNHVIRNGLANALKELVEKIDSNKLKVTLEVDGLMQDVNREIQLIVYRIFQESVHNVVKHAAASRIDIRLNVLQNSLWASVSDNGRGFDMASVKTRKGIGLDNIETRIKFLKGTYKIKSTPGEGTTLEFEIPT